MLHWWMFLKCIHIYLLLKQHMKYCTCLSRHITHSELSPLARMDSCLTRGAEGAGWSKVTSSWNRKDCWTYIKYIHGTSTAQALHAYQYITDLLSIKIMIHTNIIEVLCFILIYGHWLTFLNFFKVTLSRICKWMANYWTFNVVDQLNVKIQIIGDHSIIIDLSKRIGYRISEFVHIDVTWTCFCLFLYWGSFWCPKIFNIFQNGFS